jgi:hypothetical protein
MKAFAVCALLLLGCFTVAPAGASESPTLRLDLEHSQDLVVDAHGVPLEQLLKTLGENLNFSVDISPLASRSMAVSGKFEGNIDEILADILRGSNYVAQYGPQGISKLVVAAPSGQQPPSTPAAAPTTTAVAVDVKSPTPAPVGAKAQSAPSSTAQSAPAPVAAAAAGGGDTPPSVLSKLLSVQAGAMLPSDPNAPAVAPTTGAQSLGVMTRVAQSNVQALVSALNAACIGSTCGH